MTDREKVMTWLEICGKNNDCSSCCPWANGANSEREGCKESLMADALWLLKTDSCENCAMAVEDRQMIVRCKDCKWWKDYKCENDYVLRQIFDCGCYPDFHTDSNWFCAEGERR